MIPVVWLATTIPRDRKIEAEEKQNAAEQKEAVFFTGGVVHCLMNFPRFSKEKVDGKWVTARIPNVGIPLASWDMKPEPIAKLNPAFCDALFAELVGYNNVISPP